MTLPAAKNAVAAMPKQATTLDGFCPDSSGSPLGKSLTAWADAIEPALSLPDAGAVAWMTEESYFRLFGCDGNRSRRTVPIHAKPSRVAKIPVFTRNPAPASAEVTEAQLFDATKRFHEAMQKAVRENPNASQVEMWNAGIRAALAQPAKEPTK